MKGKHRSTDLRVHGREGNQVILTFGTRRRPSAPGFTNETPLRRIEAVAGIDRIKPIGDFESAPVRDCRKSQRERKRGYLLSSSTSEREHIWMLPAVARVTGGSDTIEGKVGSNGGVETVE